MSSGSEDELPDWVKTFSSPPIKGKTVAKRRALIVDSDEEDAEPAPPPAPVPAKPSESQAGKEFASDMSTCAEHDDLSMPCAEDMDVVIERRAAEVVPPDTMAAGTQENNATAGTPRPEVLAAGPKGDIAVIFPDKIPTTKILLELQSSDHSSVTDLAGDAGAVGRITMASSSSAGSSEDRTFQVDLKGVLYNAAIVPLAGTALVLNLGTSEAKVEAIMHDFVRLTEEVNTAMETMEGDFGDLLAGSDDEVYQLPEEGEAGATADGKVGAAGPVKKRPAVGAKSKKAGGSAKGGPSGGVKKAVKKAGSKKPGASKAKAGRSVASAKKEAGKKPKAVVAKAMGTAAKPKPAAKKKAKKAGSSSEEEEETDGDESDELDDGDGEDSE